MAYEIKPIEDIGEAYPPYPKIRRPDRTKQVLDEIEDERLEKERTNDSPSTKKHNT